METSNLALNVQQCTLTLEQKQGAKLQLILLQNLLTSLVLQQTNAQQKPQLVHFLNEKAIQ